MGTKAQQVENNQESVFKSTFSIHGEALIHACPKTSGLPECFQKMNKIVYSNNQINLPGGERIIIVLIRIGSVDDPFIQELPSSDWALLLQRKWKLFLNHLWCWVMEKPKPGLFESFPLQIMSMWPLRHCSGQIFMPISTLNFLPPFLLSSAFSFCKRRDCASFFCEGFCWTKAIDSESHTLTSNP